MGQWEDPCPFWDDDGQAYLVRGRLGAGPIFLQKMTADGSRLLDDGVEIYRGPVAEGPKLFKHHGWYYISLPEGGVEAGGQSVLRSRRLYGPYERRVVTPEGVAVTVIAGESHGVPGAVTRETTQPLYLDVHLPKGARFEQALPAEHNAFVYVYRGEASIGGTNTPNRHIL